jgi:UDP-N-acetylmuramyl pentapeptide phosphotransferase/UDP-N-acetylglucosamine-1-phosphate transferase
VLPPLAAALGAADDRWLAAFTIAVVVVVIGGGLARRTARTHTRGTRREDHVRGTRRRAGALLALGPVAGLVVAPGAGGHVAVAAVGAVALGVFGAVFERRRDLGRWVAVAVMVAALGAVLAGVRFAPTGVGILDVVLGFVVVVSVTVAFDGLGNSDALVPGLAALSAAGLLAIAGFGSQFGVANGAAGILGASVAFLAFNLPPASLFAGRGGRLATGFALGVLVCSVETVPGPPVALLVGLALVAIPLLDLGVVTFDRAQRRRPLFVDRRDHLVHRFVATGASPFEAVGVLALVQGVLVLVAVLTGRGVLTIWVSGVVAVLVLGSLGGYALRAPLERMAPVGLSRRAWWVISGLALVLVLGVVPLVLGVPGATDAMQAGKTAAQRGLSAARVGDAAEAELQFRKAAAEFARARDDLHSAKYEAARMVPGLAPNLRAARALADIGYDLAANGATVTSAVVPESLAVVDGAIPIEEVRRVTPALERGADTLERALAELRAVEKEPYLLGSVRDAINAIRPELERGAREARNTATAARLAPAIFGADGQERRYLIVVQNPAENRGTGGLIGSYGILTVKDGEVTVDKLRRTGVWNAALEASGSTEYDAPADYRLRYGQFRPETNLQSVNLSPDFPTVAKVLASLAPKAGVGDIDGVIAVDPEGLAALLRLTGPVSVAGWPVEISSDNVVDVTLSDAYVAFANTPERADFLGDVAQAAVDQATAGRLGEPAEVARVLGEAARQGHISLAFTRPREERLAASVGASGALATRGDVVHVTDANFSANKLDYYLERNLDYRVEVRPDATGRGADATGSLTVRLENTAPAHGLPQIVAGPFEGSRPGQFAEGENVSYVSVYSPLGLKAAKLDGAEVPVIAGRELGLNVYSTMVRLLARQDRTLALDLAGRVRMGRDGWYVLRLGSQPMVRPGTARISISVPSGYRITAATPLQKIYGQRATGILTLDRPVTIRVRIERDRGSVLTRLDGSG